MSGSRRTLSRRRRGRVAMARPVARKGGAGFLFFCLIGLPMLFFTAVLSVDVTGQIMAANQVTSAAQAAAVAGSFPQQTSTDRIETARSELFMRETFDRALAENVMPLAVNPRLDTARVVSPQRVEVTISYQLRVRAFSSFLTNRALGSERFTITRSAEACSPGQTSTTAGFCSSPRP